MDPLLRVSLTVALALLLFAEGGRAIEFYYNLQRNTDHCFEDHLGSQILMKGEIYFDGAATIGLRVENPANDVILTKVLHPSVRYPVGVYWRQEE